MTALIRIAGQLTFGIIALLWGNLAFAQGNYPKHVILTWSQEPSRSQSVSWRTDSLALAPLAQLALANDTPVNPDLKSVIPRVEKPYSGHQSTVVSGLWTISSFP